jgi:hypothetical protein
MASLFGDLAAFDAWTFADAAGLRAGRAGRHVAAPHGEPRP